MYVKVSYGKLLSKWLNDRIMIIINEYRRNIEHHQLIQFKLYITQIIV